MSGTPEEELDAPPGDVSEHGGEARSGEADNPTADDWIADRLHKTYDEVVSEPLPKKMLDLLDALASKERGDK